MASMEAPVAGAALRIRFDEFRRDLEGVVGDGRRERVLAVFERAAADVKAGVSGALARPFGQSGGVPT